MERITKDQIPAIKLASGCVSTPLTEDVLKDKGTLFISYGVRVGDVIEFPDQLEEGYLASRQVVPGSTATESLVLVRKNGRPDWFSIALLRRLDEAGLQSCGTVCDELQPLPNDLERVKAALGRTMIATEKVTIQTLVFKDGKPTGATTDKEIVSLDWQE